jgi:hypothetical protein
MNLKVPYHTKSVLLRAFVLITILVNSPSYLQYFSTLIKMRSAFLTVVAFSSLLSLATAYTPQCKVVGESQQDANGNFIYYNNFWANVTSASSCQSLCLAQDNCFSSAYSSQYQECNGFSSVVGAINVQPAVGGWSFSDFCCKP